MGQLTEYLKATFKWIEDYEKDARVWLLFYYYCSFNKTYLDLNSNLVSQGQQRISGLIRQGIAARAFLEARDSMDIDRRAKLLQNTLTGGLLAALTENNTLSFDPAEDVIRHCLEIAKGI